ncbi:MAG: hypothetical protein LUQ50_03195 [Methanospirillum sp.]|uniref:hypothetical protein n=1 Tax=Methanospirillum sp. TaxID=45200 RepID=UPI0023695273|nr:hypothetical protein [Methanospirillum sp.]MDD1728061.1 hypothetical protein [Methanospirillum sp.]
MNGKPFVDAINLLKKPVLLLPGLYAGVLLAGFIWLAFSGGEFIAGKLLFLGAVIFPFLVAGALGCLRDNTYTPSLFVGSAVRYFFPVLLPVIVAVAIIFLLLILFSIPYAIAGLTDPSMIGGLFIGISVPVLLFSFFADNVAVTEGLKVFASLKQSMIIASRSILMIITCIVVTVISAGALGVIMASIWGMILADRFSQYLELGAAEQLKIFFGFGLAEWQNLLRTDGILITAIMIGIYLIIPVSFFIIYKHQCYIAASSAPVPVIPTTGEYDEKGRWYKY